MRILFWYCDRFEFEPAMKTLEDAPEAEPAEYKDAVAAFIHVEPKDVEPGASAETKLVKNAKWQARKLDAKKIILHSFTHLGEKKAEPEKTRELLNRAMKRIEGAGYDVVQTPFGYFLDLLIKAPGKPLARIYKEF